jgi:hypothetical protein
MVGERKDAGKTVLLVCSVCVWSLGVVVEGIYRCLGGEVMCGVLVCAFLLFCSISFTLYINANGTFLFLHWWSLGTSENYNL